MKLKKYKEMVKESLLSDNEISERKEYISDVFLKLEDLGKYSVSYPKYNYAQNSESYFVEVAPYMDKDNRIMEIFDTIEDYLEYNKIIEDILPVLTKDYSIKYMENNYNLYVLLDIEKK
jgi:hypothetical protein